MSNKSYYNKKTLKSVLYVQQHSYVVVNIASNSKTVDFVMYRKVRLVREQSWQLFHVSTDYKNVRSYEWPFSRCMYDSGAAVHTVPTWMGWVTKWAVFNINTSPTKEHLASLLKLVTLVKVCYRCCHNWCNNSSSNNNNNGIELSSSPSHRLKDCVRLTTGVETQPINQANNIINLTNYSYYNMTPVVYSNTRRSISSI